MKKIGESGRFSSPLVDTQINSLIRIYLKGDPRMFRYRSDKSNSFPYGSSLHFSALDSMKAFSDLPQCGTKMLSR